MSIRDRIKNRSRLRADDIGLNSKSESTKEKVFLPDGSFHFYKEGAVKDVFHSLISISWTKFLLIVISASIVVNLFFATIYYLLGTENISGITGKTEFHKFVQAFFFSTQTMTTVGYGAMYPTNVWCSAVASIEAILGLLIFSIATGLFYGRFSKPKDHITYSKNILITPLENGKGLVFRLANSRQSNIVNASVKMIGTYIDLETNSRKYFNLDIAVDSITFLAMNWNIVHHINEGSPLFQLTLEQMIQMKFEFIILLSGYNESFNQQTYSKHSYSYEDIVWNAKFIIPFYKNEKDRLVFDLKKMNDFEILN